MTVQINSVTSDEFQISCLHLKVGKKVVLNSNDWLEVACSQFSKFVFFVTVFEIADVPKLVIDEFPSPTKVAYQPPSPGGKLRTVEII